MPDKKEIERIVLEAARNAGVPIPHGGELGEEPDFQFQSETKRLGVEVSELLRPASTNHGILPLEQENFHQRVLDAARDECDRRGLPSLRVQVYFTNPRGKRQDWKDLTRSLVDLVFANYEKAQPAWSQSGRTLPEDFQHVLIVRDDDPWWWSPTAGGISLSQIPITGLEISRATLDGWVLKVGELLIPMVAAMRRELISGSYVQADETPVDVQTREGRGQNHQAYLWQYSLPGGSVVFDFRLCRGRDGPKRFLGQFEGILQTDGYAACTWVRSKGRARFVRGAWELRACIDERFVDDHLGGDVRQLTSLPRLHLLSHGLEVPLRSIKRTEMQSMSENDFAKILLHYFNLRYSDRAALRTGVSAFASFHKSRKP